MITLRNTEAVSPSGQRYLVSTETRIWEGREFNTYVRPLTEDPVEWNPYVVTHETVASALSGHNQVVQETQEGLLDGLLDVRRKNG